MAMYLETKHVHGVEMELSLCPDPPLPAAMYCSMSEDQVDQFLYPHLIMQYASMQFPHSYNTLASLLVQ